MHSYMAADGMMPCLLTLSVFRAAAWMHIAVSLQLASCSSFKDKLHCSPHFC